LHVGKSATVAAAVVFALALAGCNREHAGKAPTAARDAAASGQGQVIVEGDDRIAASLTWHAPVVTLADDDPAAARKRAGKALAEGRLYADGDSAIPLYLAILKQAPDDADAKAGLQRSLTALLVAGDQALAAADDDIAALRQAHTIASVARGTAPQDKAVQAYLGRVDQADRLWELNRQAERDLQAGKLGE
jgi:hypothetical protein